MVGHVRGGLGFVTIYLLGMTVATKQPAMTAPAMAASLPRPDETGSDEAIEAFVDRADRAMYRAKSAGRNRVSVDGEVQQPTLVSRTG